MEEFVGTPRFRDKLPYRGWNWHESHFTRESAVIHAKGLPQFVTSSQPNRHGLRKVLSLGQRTMDDGPCT